MGGVVTARQMSRQALGNAGAGVLFLSQLGAGALGPRSGAGSTGGHEPLDLTLAWATPGSGEAFGGFPCAQRANYAPSLKNAHGAFLGTHGVPESRRVTPCKSL